MDYGQWTPPLERPWAWPWPRSNLQRGSCCLWALAALSCRTRKAQQHTHRGSRGGPHRQPALSGKPPSATASSRKGQKGNAPRPVGRKPFFPSPSAATAPRDSARIKAPYPASSLVSLFLSHSPPPAHSAPIGRLTRTRLPLPPPFPKTLAGFDLPGQSDRPLPRAIVEPSR